MHHNLIEMSRVLIKCVICHLCHWKINLFSFDNDNDDDDDDDEIFSFTIIFCVYVKYVDKNNWLNMKKKGWCFWNDSKLTKSHYKYINILYTLFNHSLIKLQVKK
jgi:hypothetical protein